MDDLARLKATEEIRQLASRYAVALDARDIDALGALYVDDPIDEENRSVLLRVDSLWGLGASLEWHRDNGMTVGANLSYLFTGDSPVETPDLPVLGVVSGGGLLFGLEP